MLLLQVIFSQSSDTLDHQQSVGGSSGEEASIPDASSSMCHVSLLRFWVDSA